MDRFDLYKEMYFRELERKNYITDSLRTPVTIVTGLIAWLFYFYSERYVPAIKGIPWWTRYTFYAALATLAVSMLFLVLTFFKPKFRASRKFITSGYIYGYIPFVDLFEKFYQDQLIKNNEKADNASPLSNKALEETFISNFVICTARNTKVNDQKMARLAVARFFMALSLFFSFALLIEAFSAPVS